MEFRSLYFHRQEAVKVMNEEQGSNLKDLYDEHIVTKNQVKQKREII